MPDRGARVVALATVAVLALASVAAAGPEMRVGSKQFTEGVVLGELVTQVGRAAGADAVHRAELGGTRILWEALRHGDIDAYVEYTGTVVEEILAGERLPRGDQAALRTALDAHGVALIAALGFENTYALGMREQRAAALGIRTISDLAARLAPGAPGPALVVGVSSEFLDRRDGWPGLAARYGLPAAGARGMVHDLAYRALADGAIDVTDVYTTDAEIARLRLRVLVDDRGYFPDYQAVILVRAAWARGAPDLVAALRRLDGAIAAVDMIAMNARARFDRVPAAQVAADFARDRLGVAAPAGAADRRATRIWARTQEHVALVALALALAVALGVPLGVAASRRPVLGQIVLAVIGGVQTVPSLALLVLMIPLLGIGGAPAVAAMFAYSLLPIVRNAHAGLNGLAPALRESAEVLGLGRWTRLARIELPLASPSIVAGVQTAAVLSVGTATIGALVGAGGYGQTILSGVRLADTGLLLEGALPAAALAVLVQAGFELVARALVPRGLRLRGDGL